ncbi:MAG TPA: DMT family transporter [Phycisphaerae bacterium]|nr:DMT family transporter [Phycisphaerae bacterium]
MPILAISLVLLSCFGHAAWNLLAKRRSDPVAALWRSLLLSVVLLAPFSLTFLLHAPGRWPDQVWYCLLTSSASQALYAYALGRAYRCGDLSLAYPIARSAPLFVAVWALVWLGEPIDAAGGVGIVTVVVGAVLLSLPAGRQPRHAALARTIGWAVLTALCTSVYSVADRAAMLQIPSGLGRTAYLHLEFFGMWAGLTLLVCRSRPWKEFAVRSERTAAVAIGVLQPLTYLLVLSALAMPDAGVSYVVALRQFSAVIGVVFGWRLLRESHGWMRLLSAVIMVVGLALVAAPRR